MEKAMNYSPEMTAKMVEAYASGTSVEQIADMVGKSVRSVVAKLSREGVYKKKEYTTKNGESPVAKDVLADKIGTVLGLTESDTESLTKANKAALARIVEFIAAKA